MTKVLVKEFFAFVAKNVEIIAARIANVNIIAVFVDSKRNFIGEKIFVALCAEQVFVNKATRANKGAVVNHSHLAFVVIFVAMFTEAIMLVQTAFADVNTLTVPVDDIPSFGAIVFAFLADNLSKGVWKRVRPRKKYKARKSRH